MTLARIFSTMFSKWGKICHLCVVPDLREKAFSLLMLNMMLHMGYSQTAFIRLREFPSVGGRIIAPKDVHILALQTCGYENYALFPFISARKTLLYAFCSASLLAM